MAGFTLIEMLVVLAILGFVGALVVMRKPSRSAAVDMRSASGAVAGALRLARSRAIATNRPVAVLFDTARGTVRVGADPARGLPAGIALGVVTIQDEAGPTGGAIRFLPDGSGTGGRVDLAGLGRQARVGVDWLTGRVSVAP